MADVFPSWWSASADSEPRLFQNGAEVPAGWINRVGVYDTEIGQFVTVEQAEARAAEKRKAQQALEQADAAGEAPEEAGAEQDEPEAPARRRAKARRGKSKKGPKMANQNQPGAVNEDAKGIARPQADKPVSKPQDDPDAVARERGGDGTMRSGNRPTRR
jgi:hypothetical protein